MILAGDIGGTNTRLALFDGGNVVLEKKFKSGSFKSLEEIVSLFLEGKKISRACFGVAGPVREGRCQATNLPWMIEAKNLAKTIGIATVSLLNDLEAKAYGLRCMKKEDYFVLHLGKRQEGNQAMIAAGTGLGEAGLYWDGKEHHPFACEGGHVDFAPRNPLEIELLQYLQKKHQHVSYERIVSGPGIYTLYEFFAKGKKNPSIMTPQDVTTSKDPVALQAVDLFLSLYGAESGNLALKFLSLGGFFIGGGIAPFLKDAMKGSFLSSFMDKGRFKPLLESIPIYVILNDDASLLGAAYFAAR
jgi:glucokinase